MSTLEHLFKITAREMQEERDGEREKDKRKSWRATKKQKAPVLRTDRKRETNK